MRLITREEVAAEFRMPLASVVSRMAELRVEPYPPVKKGRGHHFLYDADEIAIALQNERETRVARKQKRQPRIRPSRPGESIYTMGWSKAKLILTAGGHSQ